MRQFVLALASAAAFFWSGQVSAQIYFEDRNFYDDYEEEFLDRAPPPRYRMDGPRYYERDWDRSPRRSYRQSRIGSVCVTSRGNCDAGGGFPLNTPCRCYIPGFGPKRGAVGF